jgi:hypothetical protein
MQKEVGLVGLALALGTASCSDETSVKVRYAEGFTPGPNAVSVLGVYRDGRMSVDAWGPLALPLSAALGARAVCEPGFSARLQRDNESLFSSIDEQAKNDGVTEDLLAKLAPSAQGDVILTVTMHGSLGRASSDRMSDEPPQRSSMPSMRGMGPAGGGARGAPQRQATPRPPPPKVLEMSATLFSVRQGKPLARLTVTYGGTSAEEAVKMFTAEVGKMVPGSSCKGWSWGTKALPTEVAPILDGP